MTGNPPAKGLKARLPNILTIGRIACIPLIVAGIILSGSELWSTPKWVSLGTVILFMAACITDYLDGFWARKWNVTSDFGRMIDPIADKLLVAACLIAISIVANGVWFILVPALAIIGRDILVSGAREHAALKSRAMPPTKLAKWKTACEMLAIAILILLVANTRFALEYELLSDGTRTILRYAGLTLLWLAAILSVYTGSLYVRASLRS